MVFLGIAKTTSFKPISSTFQVCDRTFGRSTLSSTLTTTLLLGIFWVLSSFLNPQFFALLFGRQKTQHIINFILVLAFSNKAPWKFPEGNSLHPKHFAVMVGEWQGSQIFRVRIPASRIHPCLLNQPLREPFFRASLVFYGEVIQKCFESTRSNCYICWCFIPSLRRDPRPLIVQIHPTMSSPAIFVAKIWKTNHPKKPQGDFLTSGQNLWLKLILVFHSVPPFWRVKPAPAISE